MDEQHGQIGAAVNAAKAVQVETSRLARMLRESTESPLPELLSLSAHTYFTYELRWQAEQVRSVLDSLLQQG